LSHAHIWTRGTVRTDLLLCPHAVEKLGRPLLLLLSGGGGSSSGVFLGATALVGVLLLLQLRLQLGEGPHCCLACTLTLLRLPQQRCILFPRRRQRALARRPLMVHPNEAPPRARAQPLQTCASLPRREHTDHVASRSAAAVRSVSKSRTAAAS
jgi:hypothetical protein